MKLSVIVCKNTNGKLERLLGMTEELGTRTREESEAKLLFGKQYGRISHGDVRVFATEKTSQYDAMVIVTAPEPEGLKKED